MGKVSGYTRVINITPTISTTAYDANDQIGEVMELEGALLHESGRAVLQSISVVDIAGVGARIDVLFFNSEPTIASSDNDPFSMTTAEATNRVLGCGSITGYKDFSGICFSTTANIGLTLQGLKCDPVVLEKSKNIYAVAVIRNVATYSSTGDLTFKFGLFQD